MKTHSQSGQDLFVLSALTKKRDGYFLEIGSNDPVNINNSYILESEFNWKGLMVEYDKKWESSYKQKRTSNYIIQDATTVNYAQLFSQYNFPKSMDYLQIDLEVDNRSTLSTLELIDRTIFPNYTFSVVTFEHDIYRGNYFNTQQLSRNIFLKNGYVPVFKNVKNCGNPFEDWYVHPNFVDMTYINSIKTDAELEWIEIVKLLKH
jgi:hypothetical protein